MCFAELSQVTYSAMQMRKWSNKKRLSSRESQSSRITLCITTITEITTKERSKRMKRTCKGHRSLLKSLRVINWHWSKIHGSVLVVPSSMISSGKFIYLAPLKLNFFQKRWLSAKETVWDLRRIRHGKNIICHLAPPQCKLHKFSSNSAHFTFLLLE